jgi:hypothetical protein
MTDSPALALMQSHRYEEAIALFEARLRDHPTDVGALLRMGLCHLLNRSEPAFLSIHDRATALIHELDAVPTQTERLWAHYQHLFKVVTATALVVGGVASTVACGKQGISAHKYSGGVYVEPDASDSGALSAHRYSGGVFLEPETGADHAATSAGGGAADAAVSAQSHLGATAQPKPKPPSPAEPEALSAHRYSGGVYHRPKPSP